MAPQDGSSTRWLSKSTLDELVRLAEKSPKEFQLHFKRLDIRRKLQVRRYFLQQYREENRPIPTIVAQSVEVELREERPQEPLVAAPTIGDLLDEAEEDTAFQEEEETSLEALFTVSTDAEETSEEIVSSQSEEAVTSLEALFADVHSEERVSSLEALFGEEAPEETSSTVVEAESAEPTYGVPTPVEASQNEIAAFLRDSPVFQGMEEEEFRLFVSRISAVRYKSGDLICREGDPGNEMWIIREGGVRVSKQGQTVVDLTVGAPVGEMAILDGKPRSTDLIALDNPLLFVLTRESYAEVFRLDMDAGSKLVSNIVGIQQTRLRDTTQKAIENAVAAERAEGELRRAKETQELALPKNNHPAFGNSEFYVSFKGARGVSGDYYDFIEFPDKPHHLIVIMGDSTGHGLNAGLEMLLAKSASFTQVASDPSVEKITAAVNNITCYIFGATMFMTFVCALIDREKHTIRYTNAGQQSHPYLYRMRTGEFVPLESQIFQLGITPGVEYTSKEVAYEEGDLLIFYSDGIIEAPYCPEGATEVDRSQEFGDERLREIIRQNAHRTPKEIADVLLTEAKAFCRFYDGFEVINGVEVDGDDITTIIIRLG